MIDYLIVYFQFFTVIPIPVEINQSGDKLKKAVPYFPLFASLYSLLLVGIFCLLRLFLTDWTAATLCLGMDILLTRGFHYDALADTADGLFSSRSPDRMLAIMKDSTIGANGTLALILYFLLAVHLGDHLVQSRMEVHLLSFVWAWFFVGRSLLPITFYRLTYVGLNPHGLGSLFTQVASWRIFLSQVLASVILASQSLTLLAAYGGAVLFALGYRRFVIARIGGMTGDTMGALVLLGQVIFALVLGGMV